MNVYNISCPCWDCPCLSMIGHFTKGKDLNWHFNFFCYFSGIKGKFRGIVVLINIRRIINFCAMQNVTEDHGNNRCSCSCFHTVSSSFNLHLRTFENFQELPSHSRFFLNVRHMYKRCRDLHSYPLHNVPG